MHTHVLIPTLRLRLVLAPVLVLVLIPTLILILKVELYTHTHASHTRVNRSLCLSWEPSSKEAKPEVSKPEVSGETAQDAEAGLGSKSTRPCFWIRQ